MPPVPTDMRLSVIQPHRQRGPTLHSPSPAFERLLCARLATPIRGFRRSVLGLLGSRNPHVSVGCGRPADFSDLHLEAVALLCRRRLPVAADPGAPGETLRAETLGAAWLESWSQGLPEWPDHARRHQPAGAALAPQLLEAWDLESDGRGPLWRLFGCRVIRLVPRRQCPDALDHGRFLKACCLRLLGRDSPWAEQIQNLLRPPAPAAGRAAPASF